MVAVGQDVEQQGSAQVSTLRSYISAFLLLCLIAISSLGCATLAIPAIDPSGNRIFAQTPTQLTLPQLHGPNGNSLIPNASFPQPPTPPACLQGPSPVKPFAATPVASGASDRGRCGQMLLTPTRIVAPVGGEVVLLAGVCGEDGYLVSGEPIEWMLSPDSVGELIEVGDDMKGKRKSFFTSHRQPKNVVEKLDVDFARGRTSSEPGIITRGSHTPSDDLPIRKGQTWVSLTSPTEGSSRVTVLAPDSDVWDRRRQTATIYWIDAEWEFPAPQILRVGELATLTTRVTKAEGYAPAKDWIVRYRVLNPEIAQILGKDPSASGTDSRVDDDAKATIQLANRSKVPGTVAVEIVVARPANPAEKIPELPLARGQTLVTWSAPVLKLNVGYVDTTSVGKPVDFRLQLTNTGDLNADNVSLVMDLKNGSLQAEYLTDPKPSNATNTGCVWNVGVLAAQQTFETIVRITPTVESDNRIDFIASASPDLVEKATAPFLAVAPKVELKFAPAPGLESIEVGQSTVFEILATNTGRQTINDLVLTVDADQGLQSTDAGPGTGTNIVARKVSYLPPGQTQSVGLRFIARRTGELQARVIASVGEVTLADRTSFVRVIEPIPRQPGISVEIRPNVPGKTSLSQGETVVMNGVIRNTGQTRLTNIQVLFEYDPSLAVVQLSQGGDQAPAARQIVWNVPSLDPRLQIAVQVGLQGLGNATQSKVLLSARSSEAINAADEFTFSGVGPTGGGNPNDLMPPPNNNGNVANNPAENNRWSLSIMPIDSNVSVGEQSSYDITFRNNANQAEEQVVLQIAIPQGTKVVSLSTGDGEPVNATYSDDGRILTVDPIRFLRVGEQVRQILILRHEVPGTVPFDVLVKSIADPEGTRQQSRITVRPRL